MRRHRFTAFILASFASGAILAAAPAAAADGEVLITQAKALAGGVTPGDAPGFPVSISRPGSYKFASNLEVPANKHGIIVNATEVSIDLNGFRLNGAAVALMGIVGFQRSLTIRNGTIRGFKNDGVHVTGALMIVEDMRIEENGQRGVAEVGNASGFARIIRSTVFGNGSEGIVCAVSCHAEGNIISRNGFTIGASGIRFASTSGTALGNTITSNDYYGIYADSKIGFGNNTIFDNNAPAQVVGGLIPLFPNACSPVAC